MSTLLIRLLVPMLCAAALAGCATDAPALTADAKLDANQGVVFGRLSVERDGKRVTTDDYRNLLKPSVTITVSPFEGVDKLNMNTWVSGKWSVEAGLLEGGDFAIVLPPGKYYIVEFGYLDMYPGASGNMLGMRTYQSVTGISSTRDKSICTFEVRAGEATYIGDLVTRMRVVQNAFGWDLAIADDSATSTAWFRGRFPAFPAPGTGLVVKQPL